MLPCFGVAVTYEYQCVICATRFPKPMQFNLIPKWARATFLICCLPSSSHITKLSTILRSGQQLLQDVSNVKWKLHQLFKSLVFLVQFSSSGWNLYLRAAVPNSMYIRCWWASYFGKNQPRLVLIQTKLFAVCVCVHWMELVNSHLNKHKNLE